jgi:putative transcriptional regulator
MRNKLKDLRKSKGFTQESLAQKMGVSRQTINAIEKGNYAPSTVLALKMAFLLNEEVGHIFELEQKDWD